MAMTGASISLLIMVVTFWPAFALPPEADIETAGTYEYTLHSLY